MYKILIAEDELIIRKGLNSIITDLTTGFVVIGEAENGERALELLKYQSPDVLITDIRMPKLDGLGLIEKVRDLYPHLPIIIISGYGEFAYAKRAISNNVTNYLLKPINRIELVKTLENIKTRLDENLLVEYGFGDIENYLLKKITYYILKNIDQDISLQSVADIANLHPNYFSQWFKNETGENFSNYITSVRMQKAKQLLRDTNLKIYEIARLSGYQGEKHFMKLFRQLEDSTPSGYRRKKKVNLY